MLLFAEREINSSGVISVLTRVEAESAIYRLLRAGRFKHHDVIGLLTALEADVEQMIQQPVDAAVLTTARYVIARHSLRALDAVQLGSAMQSREWLAAPQMRFIASDRALLEAAQKENFEIWDPAA